LLFARNSVLMAQRFDPSTLALTGEPVVLGERVVVNVGAMRAAGFSVSDNGVLVYQSFSGTGTARVAWSDRAGHQTAVMDERLPYRDLRLSPDGTRVAVSLLGARDATSDIWIVSVGRGVRTRVTLEGRDDLSAIWSPQGTEIAFSSRRSGNFDLFRKAVSGADREEVLLDDAMDKTATSWSTDAKFLLYSIEDPRTGPDVWVLPLTGDRKPFAFLATAADERFARFSPDGHWVAYSSSESGRTEVYVTPFPGPGGKQVISSTGGRFPR
jgi:eukaryotic-like serine/threonine-protein kinase